MIYYTTYHDISQDKNKPLYYLWLWLKKFAITIAVMIVTINKTAANNIFINIKYAHYESGFRCSYLGVAINSDLSNVIKL